MRKFKMVSIAVLAIALIAVLAGCSQAKTDTKSDVELSAQKSQSDSSVSSSSSSQAFYVLIIGCDSRVGTVEANNANYTNDKNARSDTTMLARIDPSTYKITLVTIPRDTQATVEGSTQRINEAYNLQGADGLVDQVQQLTGVKISYYMSMKFGQFEDFVDKIGGVNASVPIAMSLTDIVKGGKVSLDAGTQSLNGPQALVLARTRKMYADQGEACRQIQDRQLVANFITKVANQPTSQSATYIDDLMACAQTNMPSSELSKYIASFCANKDKITVLSGTGPYNVIQADWFNNDWIVPRDEATWKELMSVVDSGGDPTTVVALPQVAAAE